MPRRGAFMRQRMRWLVVARLETAAIPADRIAQITGYHVRTITRTLENPTYQEWRNARISNGVSAIDHLLADDAREMKSALKELIPAAIHRLSICLQSKDESIALRAAVEILDRDERFQKAQIIAHTHELVPQAQLDLARKLARELNTAKGEALVLDVTPKQLEPAPSSVDTPVTPTEQSS